MRWTIQQLLTSRSERVDIDKVVDVTELTERDRELRHVSPVRVHGYVMIDRQYATFHLHAEGSMTLPCARTLRDTIVPFDIAFTERFRIDGAPISNEDETLHEPENGYVDLLPYIKENILLAIPIRVINDDQDPSDDTPNQGNGWEIVLDEDHKKTDEKTAVDPRLKDLAKFFEDDQ
ncbi:ribosomal protein L32p [Geomicrobium sp. JCM 19037]|uniref:YceD family protein n=1 Tax=unclassified Geomicrobium TaxID=2628951 RepID=UPI00045F3620|nr:MULTISPECIES: YceD family protein [unclassified Geomicrobium]GAK04064.1 ribosomal protein L32p [Geomicrobium sp. JCM 19037]GAK14502.1 ribosomal protein L32p [Geomicrobium sp. JCM 19039]